MRWFVEISSLGAKAGSHNVLCVEAPQWRHALQKARALRGDDGPLSNFSIDLLDDGYRAVDPASRLRYEVKRAPDDAPLSPGITTPVPPAVALEPAKAEPAKAEPAKAEPAKAEPTKAEPAKAEPAKEEPGKRALAQTMAYASTGAVAVKEPEPEKRPLAQTMAYASTGAATVREAPKEAPPAAHEAPKQAPAAAKEAPQDAVPSFVLVGSREENPTEASPLTYREMVFAVGPGTPEDDAKRLILDRFAHTRATLDPTRVGKLINLAVFDHVFHGKPQRRPLVTLTWKDWKGDEPELRFPAREGDAPRAPTPSNAPASMPRPAVTSASAKAEPPKSEPAKPAAKVEVAPRSEPRPAPKAEPAKAMPEPVKVEPAKAAPVKVEPSKPAAKAEPPKSEPAKAEPAKAAVMPVASTLSSAKPLTQPKPEPKAEVPVVAAKAAKAEPVKAEPKASEKAPISGPADSAPQTKPVPTAASAKVDVEEPLPVPKAAPAKAAAPAKPKKRLSGEDLITELFEACGDLHFLRDALEGAEFVLALTMEKLPSEVALISFFDLGKREFMVARQAGGPRTALAMRQPERATLAMQAMRRQVAIVVAGDELGRAADDRFRAVGVELRSLVVAPVALGGRYLGLIEIANPLDGGAFTEGDANALTYIGQQFGEFLASHGVILDRDLILAPKAAAPEPSKAAAPVKAAEPAKAFFDGSGLKPRSSARPPKPDPGKRR
jgi:hypothetical protein